MVWPRIFFSEVKYWPSFFVLFHGILNWLRLIELMDMERCLSLRVGVVHGSRWSFSSENFVYLDILKYGLRFCQGIELQLEG